MLGLFFIIFVFSNKHYNFLQQRNVKKSIQYTVLGIEPTIFVKWVSSHNH